MQTLTTITTQRDSKLNSIASTRSSAAATLLTQNNALSGSADYLLNQKTVNGIFLQTLASGNGYLSAAQMSSLQSTAGQCPLSGGEAVLIARDMLALINAAPVFYDDDVLCTAAPRTLVKAGGIENGLGNIISIFPNPASDEVTIQYDLQNKGISRLQFFNIYGQLVREILLPDSKGKVSTSTSTLESGIYIYTLDGVTAGRLIINR